MSTPLYKRIITLLLVGILCCGLLPTAFAAETMSEQAEPTDESLTVTEAIVDSKGSDIAESNATDSTIPKETVESSQTLTEEIPEVSTDAGANPPETLPVESQPSEAAFEGDEVTEPINSDSQLPEAIDGKSALELYAERLDFLNDQDSALDVEFILQPSELAYTQMKELQPMAAGDHEYFNKHVFVIGWEKTYTSFQLPNGKDKSEFMQYALDMNGDGRLSRNEMAYCIEPYVDVLSGNIYNSTETSAGTTESSPWGSLTSEQQTAIGLTVLYGYPNMADDSNSLKQRLCDQLATGAIIHEIVLGWRNPLPPYNCTHDAYADAITNPNNSGHFTGGIFVANAGLEGVWLDYDRVRLSYDRITESLAKHTIPSFMKGHSHEAPEYTMNPTENGKYTLTLTDSVGTLANFNFPSIPGVTFIKNGNDLTITADSYNAIPSEAIKAVGKDLPSAEKSAYLIWNGNKNGEHSQDQICLKPGGAQHAPIPAYFKLSAPPSGSIRIEKEVNDGTLAGWRFGVYTDAECTHPISGSPFTTPSNGVVVVNDLLPGTYYVKEIDDSASYPHWKFDTSRKDIVVSAGQTSTTTVTNTLLGRIVVQKNAINGSPSGWTFEIRNSAGNLVDTITTGADGKAVSCYLEPGAYTVREIHDRDENYWTYDSEVEKGITVIAGKDQTVGYTNEQFSLIKVVKAMDTDGPLDGWQFRITDSSGAEIAGSPFTSEKDGTITTGKLKPGQYTVEELIPADSLYYCKTENPQTITAAAGQTAVVCFTNALRPGKIGIIKTDAFGNPLENAKFLLEWSKDGSDWMPVHYSEQGDVVLGGCSNELLVDGCLVSGTDGVVEWNNLYPGIRYRITEVEAPEGYNLLTTTAWEGELPVEDLTVQLRVVNTPIFTMPKTGSSSMLQLTMVLVLCGAVCATSILILKKKEN